MAGTEVVPFHKAPAALPAHIAAFGASNIDPKNNVDQLSIKGKVWRMIINGKEEKVMKKDGEGEMVPAQIVRVVILQHNKARSRSYFEGDFDEKKPVPPTCWSSTGDTPDDVVPAKQKQAATCAKCPKAVKGSKVTDNGKESVACSQFKRLGVLASGAILKPEVREIMPPMMLKLPQTSLWDKDTDAQAATGWFAWDQYLDMLRSKGVSHTGLVETKLKFDPTPAYPKVLFSASRFLEPNEIEAVQELFTDAKVAKLLESPEHTPAVTKAPDGSVDATNLDEDDAGETPAAPAPAPAAAPKKGGTKKTTAPVAAAEPPETPAVAEQVEVVEDDQQGAETATVGEPETIEGTATVVPDDDDEEAALAAQLAAIQAKKKAAAAAAASAPAPKPAAKPAAKPAPVATAAAAMAGDDDDVPPVAPKPAAKPAAAAAPAAAKPAGAAGAVKDKNLKSLLDDWPDDE